MLNESDSELLDDFLSLINCSCVDQVVLDSHRMWFVRTASGTAVHSITRVNGDYVPVDGEFLDRVIVVYGSGAKFLACTFVGDISVIYIDSSLYESISQYLSIVSVDKVIFSGRMLLDYEMMHYFRLRFIAERLRVQDSELAHQTHAHLLSKYRKSFEFLDQVIPAIDHATSTVFCVSNDEKERIVRNYILAHELTHVWRKKYRELFGDYDELLRNISAFDFSTKGYSEERSAVEISSHSKAMKYHDREYAQNLQYKDEIASDYFATHYFLTTEYYLFEKVDRAFDLLEVLYLAVLDAATKILDVDRNLIEVLKQGTIEKVPPLEEGHGRYSACLMAIQVFRLFDKPLFDTKAEWKVDNALQLAALAEVNLKKLIERPKSIEKDDLVSWPLLEPFLRKRDRLFFQGAADFAKEFAEFREAAR